MRRRTPLLARKECLCLGLDSFKMELSYFSGQGYSGCSISFLGDHICLCFCVICRTSLIWAEQHQPVVFPLLYLGDIF